MKTKVSLTNLAVFASGSGSNAEQIFKHFDGHFSIRVKLLVCNRKHAGVIARAQEYGIPIVIINKQMIYQSTVLVETLSANQIDWIALAGFLWLIPSSLVQAFPNKILNIHPALLPKYGGKGMFGMHVHEAVKQAQEKVSGMTVHLVNDQYDEGAQVFQAQVALEGTESAAEIAAKVLVLEHRHYASVIESFIENST